MKKHCKSNEKPMENLGAPQERPRSVQERPRAPRNAPGAPSEHPGSAQDRPGKHPVPRRKTRPYHADTFTFTFTYLGPSPGTNELPIRPKSLRIRPWKYFFMLRSILMLPGLKIPIKSKQITNFLKKSIFGNFDFSKSGRKL